jgi:ketosteroid isomerase-like protein
MEGAGTALKNPARVAAEAYVAAVNAADLERLMRLFAPNALVRHPSGTYGGRDAIRAFYQGRIFPARAQLTAARLVADGGTAMMQLVATGAYIGDGEAAEAVDVFEIDDVGRIQSLAVYYLVG